jgi:predicted acyl esterase
VGLAVLERFEGEFEIAGRPVASLLVSSSATATDFIARLTLVEPDGRSLALVRGIWSGRIADLPSASGDSQHRRCEIELGPIHIALLPGQRLRLQVTSSCYPEICLSSALVGSLLLLWWWMEGQVGGIDGLMAGGAAAGLAA